MCPLLPVVMSTKGVRLEESEFAFEKPFFVSHQNLRSWNKHLLSRLSACSYVTLATWDSQSGPITSASFGNLLQMQILDPYLRPTEAEILVVGLGICF